MSKHRPLALRGLVIVISAASCAVDDDRPPSSATEASSAAESTGASTGGPEPGTGSATDAGSPEPNATGPDSTGPNGTSESGGVAADCEAGCIHNAPCDHVGQPLDECVAECEAFLRDAAGVSAACEDAAHELLECQIPGICDDERACIPELDAYDAACGRLCTTDFQGPAGGDSCVYTLQCTRLQRQMTCDAQSCVCMEDGEVVARCAAGTLCLEAAQAQSPMEVSTLLEEFLPQCCGWDP